MQIEQFLMDDTIETQSNMIPLMADDDEVPLECNDGDTLPVLPLRNMVLFPQVVMPVNVGRKKSLRIVREVYQKEGELFVGTQIDATVEDPKKPDLWQIGTIARIVRILEMPDGTTTVILQGKKRATIANYLRLLKLPAEIQMGLKDKRIDMGHARALISVEDPEVQIALYEQILADGLSVRSVEELVKFIASGGELEKKKGEAKPAQTAMPDEFKLLREHLSSFFQTKVQLTCNNKGKGKITIPFSSEEELEKLISLLDNIK